ncbi:MAG: hypothetical protein WDN44_11030 [Sphingomonas sp.]
MKRWLPLLALAATAAAPARGPATLIHGARVFDGTGAPAAIEDVLVRGDRIVAGRGDTCARRTAPA